MIKAFSQMVLSISFLAVSFIADATLITNGGFEQLRFEDDSRSSGIVFNTNLAAYERKRRAWDVFYTLPGWVTSYGNGIELQKNVVTRSQEGKHHVELDSHPRGASNTVMSQTIDSLILGNDYLLEFYYKPRTYRFNDNGINVFWQDSALDFEVDMQASFIADGTRRTIPDWIKQSVVLTAQSESMSLSFGSFGRQNTLGGLIDNVSLTQVTSVPEPSTMILFMLSFGFFVLRPRKQLEL